MSDKHKWSSLFAGWIGSLSLSDWNLIVAIVGGVVVITLGLLQIYLLWRDKIKR